MMPLSQDTKGPQCPPKAQSTTKASSLLRGKSISPKTNQARKTTLASILNTIIPNRRPERGGTQRDKGYWETVEQEEGEKIQRQRPLTPSPAGDNTNPDRLVRWNTAKALPPNRRVASADRHPTRSLPISNGHQTQAPDNRRRSWNPKKEPPTEHTLVRRTRLPLDLKDCAHKSETHPLTQLSAPPANAGRRGCPIEQRRQADAERSIVERIEARRQRKTLKESGDYLGVQGVNPHTGQLDIITPSGSSEDKSDPSSRTREKWRSVSEKVSSAKEMHNKSVADAFGEMREFLVQKEKERAARAALKKEEVKDQQSSVRWRKDAGQWSSVQEPNLSPIVGSIPGSGSDGSKNIAEQAPKQPGETLIELGAPAHGSTSHQTHHGGQAQPPPPPGGSNETIIRFGSTGHGSDVSESALELFENGINFESSPTDWGHVDKRKTPDRGPRKDPANTFSDAQVAAFSDTAFLMPSTPISSPSSGVNIPMVHLTTPNRTTHSLVSETNHPREGFHLASPEVEPRGPSDGAAEKSQAKMTIRASGSINENEGDLQVETHSNSSQEGIRQDGAFIRDQAQDKAPAYVGAKRQMTENRESSSESSLRTFIERGGKMKETRGQLPKISLARPATATEVENRRGNGVRRQATFPFTTRISLAGSILTDPKKEAQVRERLLQRQVSKPSKKETRTLEVVSPKPQDDEQIPTKEPTMREAVSLPTVLRKRKGLQNPTKEIEERPVFNFAERPQTAIDRYASIRTITTTGFNQQQVLSGQAVLMESTERMKGPQETGRRYFSVPRPETLENKETPSPTRETSNPSQKVEPQAATPEQDTISVRALQATKERTKKLSARASAKEPGMSLTSTSTFLPRTLEDDIWLNEAMRDGAARLAVTSSLESAKEKERSPPPHLKGRRPSPKVKKMMASVKTTEGPAQGQERPHKGDETQVWEVSGGQKDNVGTEDPSPTLGEAENQAQDEATQTEEGSDADGQTSWGNTKDQQSEGDSTGEEQAEGGPPTNEGEGEPATVSDESSEPAPAPKARPIHLLRKLLQVAMAIIEWYLELIRPCFESESEWWERFRQEETTWLDLLRGILALAAIVAAIVTLAWFVGVVQSGTRVILGRPEPE